MNEISPEFFCCLLPELQDLPINELFARSVLRRQVQGRVWGNSSEAPSLIYIAHPYGMSLLLGTPTPDELPALRTHLLDRSRRLHDEWLQVWPTPVADTLVSLLGGTFSADNTAPTGPNVQRFVRSNFRFDAELHAALRHKLQAPASVRIQGMDSALFGELACSVSPQAFWRDAVHFEREGLGFCSMLNGTPTATAFAAILIDGQLEIGIETLPAWRGRGHALWVASALIEACQQRGITPVWSCRRENVASWRLAQKLGFVPTLELPYFRLPA